MSAGARYRSKALATWLALLGGALGLHRFYLHGLADPWGWLLPPLTGLGAIGVQRALALGQDDRLSWLLIPLLGIVLVVATLAAIVHALTPDERWNARYNPGGPVSRSGWPTVIGAALALALGACALLATAAFTIQRIFESFAAGS